MLINIIEWISTILFIIAGVISITKYILRVKVKLYFEILCAVANGLWLVWCIAIKTYGFIWVGALYTVLGIIGIINFNRIRKKI